MNYTEMVVFIIYLLFMLSIGIWFFYKNRQGGEKTYFLGGRQMGPWVTALSAGASDMSAWVLMGLPTSIYALGLGQAWISIGLLTGYSLSWIFRHRACAVFPLWPTMPSQFRSTSATAFYLSPTCCR